MHFTNKKQVAAGIALIGAGILEMAAIGAPCPLCVASVGSGAAVIKQSIGL